MSDSVRVYFNKLTNCDENYWRVDWFGYLNYVSRSAVGTGDRRSEPLVDVFLSKLQNPPSDTHFNKKSCSDYQAQRCEQVPVELLTIMRIGDIWRKGELVATPGYHSLNFEFESRSAFTIQAGEKMSESNFWIPSRIHPYHLKATRTFCEVVKINEQESVVFPHFVILQAYFSKCPYLFRSLFQYGFHLSRIYNKDRSDFGDGNPAGLMLYKRVTDAAAAEVARIVWDESAKSAVKKVSEVIAVQSSNRDRVRPKTKFPFTDRTSMRVKGRWCTIENQQRNFVVYEVQSCSAGFPFQSLEFFRDNPGDVNEEEMGRPSEGSSVPPKIRSLPSDSCELNAEEEPSDLFEELKIPSRTSIHLEDLRHKPIKKVRMHEHLAKKMNKRRLSDEVEVSEVCPGDGTKDSEGAPLGIDSSMNEHEKNETYMFPERICRLEMFVDFMSQMKGKGRVGDYSFICLNTYRSANNGRTSFFPDAYTEKGNLITWVDTNLIQGIRINPSQGMKRRQCVVCKIPNGLEWVYLFESERRVVKQNDGWVEKDFPALLKIESSVELPLDQLRLVLLECSRARGVWSKSLPRHCRVTRKVHPDNQCIDSGEYFDRLERIVFSDERKLKSLNFLPEESLT